jgi:hypothetical protein
MLDHFDDGRHVSHITSYMATLRAVALLGVKLFWNIIYNFVVCNVISMNFFSIIT